MMIRFISGLLLSVLLAGSGYALPAAAAAPTPASRHLTVVIVVSLLRQSSAVDDFDRMAEVFGRIFDEQKWPVETSFERFAANNDAHDLELRIFYQGIYREFDEDVYKAWTVLYDHGVKHDFGIVEYRYLPRPGELPDDIARQIYAGAAAKMTDLIRSDLPPAPAPAKR